MPPKRDFSQSEDEALIDIFRARDENNWSNPLVASQFRVRTSSTVSYPTLLKRYNTLTARQSAVITPISQRNEDIEVNPLQMLDHPMVLGADLGDREQPRSSLAYSDNLADMTIEIEENMSGLTVDTPVAGIVNIPLPLTDIVQNLVEPPIIEAETPDEDVVRRRPGRPPGRRHAPLTVQEAIRRTRSNVANETPEQRRHRLHRDRRNRINYLNNMTPEATQEHLNRNAQLQTAIRANETPEETNRRVVTETHRQIVNRAVETPEATIGRVATEAQRQRENRANETVEEQNFRQTTDAQRRRIRRANETPEAHERRLQYQRDYRAERRVNETAEQRNIRLGLVHIQRHEQQFLAPTHGEFYISRNTDIVADDQGALDQVCEFCEALFWPKEVNSRGVYTKCCERNKINVPKIDRYHPTMVRLLDPTNQNPEDVILRRELLLKIRDLNAMFGMVAVKSHFDPFDLDNTRNADHRYNARGNRRLPFLYRVHGAVYYRIPPMFNGPVGRQNLRAAQYLMLDTDRAIVESMVNNWQDLNGHVAPILIEMIQEMLAESNPLVQFFYSNREILQTQNEQDPLTVRLWMTRFVPRNTTVPINERGRRQIADNAVRGDIAAVFSDLDGLPDDGFIAYAQAREQQLPLISIVPQSINNYLKSIDQRDPNCDPLSFPLMFVFGEAGYDPRYEHNQLVRTANHRVTMKEFYKHRLHMRNSSLNLMFLMGKLFQEYIVCSWIKIEKNNLQFLRQNQALLRIMDYQGIMDHVETNLNPENAVGRAFILPSTFEGSDRAMKKHYFDGMEIAGRFEKADLFITYTSNPYWPELQATLVDGSNYLARPDMCSRMYNLKFTEFWNDLTRDHKMGVVEAFVQVKEYQKRGLAHHHSLIWLDERDKPTTIEQIDDLICAELPDRELDPELYELVTTKMMHGPCLAHSACMQLYGDRCSKGYPKEFSEATVIRPDNYPQYRRRNDGRTVTINGHVLDNRNVVPYNPALLRKNRCHINVEICGFLSSMKYLFNYMCKGNDRVNVQTHGMNNQMPFANAGLTRDELDVIVRVEQEYADRQNGAANQVHDQVVENDDYGVQLNHEVGNVNQAVVEEDEPANPGPHEANAELIDVVDAPLEGPPIPVDQVYDEIKTYEEKRIVSSIEAADKIFGFPRLALSHTIVQLLVHLDRRQNIVFHPSRVRDIAARPPPASMLTDFFALNVRDPAANQYTYKEIVHHYTFNKTAKEWTLRTDIGKASRVIARLPYFGTAKNELYHLMLLLIHVRGPTSYEFLRTVNGHVHPTFQAASRALNLVDNSRHWYEVMDEITRIELPYRIRFLFATILVHNNPADPSALELWDRYKDLMVEDFQHDPVETRYHKALGHLRHLLAGFGRTLADYYLPEPDERGLDWRHRGIPANYDDMTAEQHGTIALQLYNTLNAEQKAVVDTVMADVLSLDRTKIKCHYMDGPGGTGKTYVLNVLYHTLKQLGYTVVPTAFTGIAAALLVGGGQTCHSKFRIPIPTNLGSISKIAANSAQAEQLRACMLFIIDEASMVSCAMLDCIDKLLRDLMGVNIPFGGKVMLLTGDFRQCAPVSENENIEASILMSLKKSSLWPVFNPMALVENLRADANEREFKDWLLDIGNGRSHRYDGEHMIRLPDRVVCRGSLIDEVFGPGQLVLDDQNRLNNAILCPTNKDSLEINEVILARLAGPNRSFLSTTHILDRETDAVLDSEDHPIEAALRCTPRAFPPHVLNLKVGAIVMLLKNWSLADGLCNGTRFRVVECHLHAIKVAVLNGPNAGREFLFCRTEFRSPLTEAGLRISRFQFPFRLAFAMTINKSQGQTFNRVGLLLRKPVFAHGQLYVAASRVRNFDSLRILVQTHDLGLFRQGELRGYDQDGGVYTKNVVYRELLN